MPGINAEDFDFTIDPTPFDCHDRDGPAPMQIESYRRIRLSVNRFGLGIVRACRLPGMVQVGGHSGGVGGAGGKRARQVLNDAFAAVAVFMVLAQC